MGFSNLVNGVKRADESNYTQGRKGYKICKFTPHHMAGVLTAERCCELFQNPNRNASANYTIGFEGELFGCVDEENRAWTSSNRANDCQAITVEVSNSMVGGNWPISDASWNTLVNLAEDVCRRYNFRLEYDGTPNGSLTTHDMFAATNCPGPCLKNKMAMLAEVVNARLDGDSPDSIHKPSNVIAREVIAGLWGNGQERKDRLAAAGYDYNTIQKMVNNLVSGKPATQCLKSINEIANEVIAGKWGNGQDRKQKLEAMGYNYAAVQAEVNRILGANVPPKKSNEQIANEVIAGKWGNNPQRKQKLIAAGYDYNAIQRIVNSKL